MVGKNWEQIYLLVSAFGKLLPGYQCPSCRGLGTVSPSWDLHRMTRKHAGETLVSISQTEKLIPRLGSLWLGLLVGLQFHPAGNSTDG